MGENITGERTSKNAAVDYFIGSLDFINIVSNSKVLDFSCLYSDIHSTLDIDIEINKCSCKYGSVPINSMSEEKIKKWDINKKQDFIINLDREKISENYLEEIKSFPADSNIINKAVENITNIIIISARKTFETLKNKSKNENTLQSTRSKRENPG
ncbi:CYP2R1 [Mytilus edulis]|uniref:CYP2R1 n=1 Tax=Mytilus edulis TaxID=6550 RepID=A0A8S3RQY9_MYTED|nr:CYP2R1 [Mytilus edulis]